MLTMKKLREERGLSQAALSALTGIAIPTISRLENGHRRPANLTRRAIAHALGVRPEDIEWPAVSKKTV